MRFRLASGLAAGNVVGGSCNIAGTVGYEEGDQVADFVELAVTSERDDLGVICGQILGLDAVLRCKRVCGVLLLP